MCCDVGGVGHGYRRSDVLVGGWSGEFVRSRGLPSQRIAHEGPGR